MITLGGLIEIFYCHIKSHNHYNYSLLFIIIKFKPPHGIPYTNKRIRDALKMSFTSDGGEEMSAR